MQLMDGITLQQLEETQFLIRKEEKMFEYIEEQDQTTSDCSVVDCMRYKFNNVYLYNI